MGNQESALPATLLRLQILLTIITTSYNYYFMMWCPWSVPRSEGLNDLTPRRYSAGQKLSWFEVRESGDCLKWSDLFLP